MNWNLVRNIYGRFSIKTAYFVQIRLQKWLPQAFLVSDWSISTKSSPLKLLGQMVQSMVGNIYWRSSIKIAHFVPICVQIWPSQAIFVSGWSISTKSSPLKPLGQMNRNLVGSIYGRSSIKTAHFIPIRLWTWPSQAILLSDWSISKKIFGQMNRNLVEGTYMVRNLQSYLKIEWKVGDTASSFRYFSYVCFQ